MDLIDDLAARGLIHDSTDREVLRARLASGPIGVYVGFDPTADSLHVGNLLGQVTLRRFQLAGHRVFPLAGGATGMIGDPGGRSTERNLLDRETLRHNVSCIKRQLAALLEFDGPNPATLVDNAEWTAAVSVLDFLRDVGKHVTVNQMLAKESVRSRVESEHGISFTEFSYMLLQANDFRHLCEHHDVELQMGGSDQWGNIVAGVDLIRRVLGRGAYGLTWPLVTKADGTKFGKSVGGAVWLDSAKTSPYQFWQFWLQTDDADVERYLRQFSLRPVEEIAALSETHRAAPERRLAQRTLAGDVTALLHGHAATDAAVAAADLVFGGDPTTAPASAWATLEHELPSTVVPAGALEDLVGLLVRIGLATSNGDARRALDQRGIYANGHVASAGNPIGILHGRYVLLRRGKKNQHLVVVGA
jgi:tyrosyl-tRNA synthetase